MQAAHRLSSPSLKMAKTNFLKRWKDQVSLKTPPESLRIISCHPGSSLESLAGTGDMREIEEKAVQGDIMRDHHSGMCRAYLQDGGQGRCMTSSSSRHQKQGCTPKPLK